MSSVSPSGSHTRANPPPPSELNNGSVTLTAAADATAASAAFPPARQISAAASAAYGVPAEAAKVRVGPVPSIGCYSIRAVHHGPARWPPSPHQGPTNQMRFREPGVAEGRR